METTAFNLDPPKTGSPQNKFIFGPTLKNLFLLWTSHKKANLCMSNDHEVTINC